MDIKSGDLFIQNPQGIEIYSKSAGDVSITTIRIDKADSVSRETSESEAIDLKGNYYSDRTSLEILKELISVCGYGTAQYLKVVGTPHTVKIGIKISEFTTADITLSEDDAEFLGIITK